MGRAPSGEQWTIRHTTASGAVDEVTVVEVGGGLRSWTRAGVPVLAGYAVDEMCLAGRGQVLFPWPNRVRDGQWTWEATTYQLPLTEPKLHNASHGLLRWAVWSLVELTESAVTVAARVFPQPGWPWPLDIALTYALDDAGLSVTANVINPGQTAAAFGLGFHPYVSIGDTPPGEVVLRVPAESYVTVDDRLLPTGVVSVRGADRDFRDARPLADTALDTAFGGLGADADDRWRVTLDGLHALPRVTVWADEAFGWAQVFTGKVAAEGEHGIAVEPTTCPPDALRSGTDLVLLQPGATWTAQWGVSLAG